MRWIAGGVLLFVLVLLWYLPARDREEGTDNSGQEVSTAADQEARVRHTFAPPPKPPTLPDDAVIRIDTSSREAEDEAMSEIERKRRQDRRDEFRDLFEEFRLRANLSDAQTQEVLLVLYDFQETYLAAEKSLYAGSDTDPTVMGFAGEAITAVYTEGISEVVDRLRQILSLDQYYLWHRVGMRHQILNRIIESRPLTAKSH